MQEVIMENTKLKKEIDKLERDKKELNELIAKKENPGVVIKNEKAEFEELNKEFTRLSKQVEFHQKMERDLLEKIMKLRDYNEVNK
jgi:seryl-tRNA synthetase